ncbi:MAG: hypothetical protein IJ301_00690 [Clostridia bacterium]|nr:hypothetical protein [Clostridia bacterium]
MAENQKAKQSNPKTKYILLGVAVAVLVVAIVLVIVFTGKSEAKAVMQLEANPGVQLVLDNNNKVVGEVALNADGEELLANVSFMGLSATVAAEKFAQTSAEMDKMNNSTTSTPAAGKSTTVVISISADDAEAYAKLAQNAKAAVNNYFSENGIFAGAVTSVNENIDDAISELGVSAKEYANMTNAEMLEYAKTKSNELKQVAFEKRADLTTKFNTLYNTILQVADSAMVSAKELLDSAQDDIDNLPAGTPATVKQQLQQAYNIAKQAYDETVKTYNTKKAELEKQFKEFVKQIQEQSKAILNELKTAAKTAYDATVEAYNTHVNAFKELSETEKEARQDAIADFQAALA